MSHYNINQSIMINFLKVGSLSNSSVFQIGSAGLIKPSSHLYNTGGFSGPAPQLGSSTTSQPSSPTGGTTLTTPSVPLVSPTR